MQLLYNYASSYSNGGPILVREEAQGRENGARRRRDGGRQGGRADTMTVNAPCDARPARPPWPTSPRLPSPPSTAAYIMKFMNLTNPLSH